MSDRLTPAGNPLPDAVHLTVLSIDEADDQNDNAATLRWLQPRGRLVVVGDVHGCRPALERLLRAVQFQPGKDNLVLTGDLVTKGPDSVGVIELAMRLGALVARGNHDDLALAASKAPSPPPPPDFLPALRDKHLQWLASLPFTLKFPDYGVVVAHAGLVPGVRRREQALRDVTRMRELVAVDEGEDDATAPSMRRNKKRPTKKWRAVEAHEAGSVPWAPEWHGPGHVFFGHDSALGLQRTRAATGLDTGCVYGGRLTCAVLPPLEELKKRRRRWWWRRVLGWWFCCGGAELRQQLPRTPRFERDLRGRIVSVPSSAVPSSFAP